MLGAAGNLAAAGFCVDAVVSRAFVNGLDRVIRLRADGRLGSTVVVSLGTNGSIGRSDLDRMMAELATVPRVVVMTTKADRGWVPPNNDLLRTLPAMYPNVRLVDWAGRRGSLPRALLLRRRHPPPPGRPHLLRPTDHRRPRLTVGGFAISDRWTADPSSCRRPAPLACREPTRPTSRA